MGVAKFIMVFIITGIPQLYIATKFFGLASAANTSFMSKFYFDLCVLLILSAACLPVFLFIRSIVKEEK